MVQPAKAQTAATSLPLLPSPTLSLPLPLRRTTPDLLFCRKGHASKGSTVAVAVIGLRYFWADKTFYSTHMKLDQKKNPTITKAVCIDLGSNPWSAAWQGAGLPSAHPCPSAQGTVFNNTQRGASILSALDLRVETLYAIKKWLQESLVRALLLTLQLRGNEAVKKNESSRPRTSFAQTWDCTQVREREGEGGNEILHPRSLNK